MMRIQHIDREQAKTALGFWLLALFPILFAILGTAELIDGDTSYLWDHKVTIWNEPGKFSVSACLVLGYIALASVFYLAAVSATNDRWLPVGLRDKPLKLLAFVLLCSMMIIALGSSLATGQMEVSGRAGRLVGRHLSEDGTPIRFAIVFLSFLIGLVAVGGGWYAVYHRWKNPAWGDAFIVRKKPQFDDPTKRDDAE